MFIQTENTPNPATIKFIPGVPVMKDGGVSEFKTREDAVSSSLAERLFEIQGVASVFFGQDFVSVTKGPEVEWAAIKAPILGAVMQHFSMGEPLFKDTHIEAQTAEAELDDLSKQIKELIDKRVRPAVAMDGGDIIFDRFEEGIVFLKMRGACAGCPSSTVTLKNGVENMLRHYVPEVLEVRQSPEY